MKMQFTKTAEPDHGYQEAAEFPALPAMKTLGHLAVSRPVVIRDTREQTPLVFRRLACELGTLTTGDYSFAGGENVFAVERKSIADLVACCMNANRERFERELHRLRGFWFARLLVVGARADVERGNYRSDLSPVAVLSTLAAFEVRYGVPVVWVNDPEAAARQVESWVWWCARELVVQANEVRRGSKRL